MPFASPRGSTHEVNEDWTSIRETYRLGSNAREIPPIERRVLLVMSCLQDGVDAHRSLGLLFENSLTHKRPY